MKAILLQVRDGMWEDGTLCNAMMNVILVVGFGSVIVNSIGVLI